MKLGKLEQITDLRSVWKHEAKDFTPWLAKEENLEILSEAVGIDIVVEEQESNVGDFSVDLFATEEGTGRRIIIENQLEETNHDHLGKIITYASGKEAEVIIWIVRKARDEHKQAIEWLNQHTDDKFEFFLIVHRRAAGRQGPESGHGGPRASTTLSWTGSSAARWTTWSATAQTGRTSPWYACLGPLRCPWSARSWPRAAATTACWPWARSSVAAPRTLTTSAPKPPRALPRPCSRRAHPSVSAC